MHYFLDLEVWKRLGEIFLSQGKYFVKLLEKFVMVECKSMHTPMEMNFKKLYGKAARPSPEKPTEYGQLIGALMFLINTRRNVCFVVNTLSQHMIDPFHAHWIAAKNVLRYLHGTINLGLKYTTKNVRLHRYIDVDWVGNFADRKNTLGCCFSLGSAMISWMSRKQKSIALSTAEASNSGS